MELVASTQYGDWAGSTKADSTDPGGDRRDIRKLLEEKGLIKDDDFIVGWYMFAGENHRRTCDSIGLHVITIAASNHASAAAFLKAHDPVPSRDIRIELTPSEFFGLFKRFSIAMAWNDLGALGREYQCETEYVDNGASSNGSPS